VGFNLVILFGLLWHWQARRRWHANGEHAQ